MARPVVALHGVSKKFESVRALSDVTLEFAASKVHALLGENGSGKSTAVKILSGALQPSSGSISIDGADRVLKSPRDAMAAGIATIYQDSALVSELTVAENVMLGKEPGRVGMIGAQLAVDAVRWLDKVGATVDPHIPVGQLPIASQQLVAIAKALSQQARLLILDEPTAALGHDETARLMDLIAALRSRGLAILYITHRLGEVRRLADTLMVLKDGHVVTVRPSEGVGEDEIVRLMVGREIREFFPQRGSPREKTVLAAYDVESADGEIKGASLEVRAGEILGLAGVEGSGRARLARLLAGVEPAVGGRVMLDGMALGRGSPAAAIARGLGYVPPDRRKQGIVPLSSVESSVSQSALRRFALGPLIKRREERRATAELVRRFDVRTSSMNSPMHALSGGNQQKVLLARTLCAGAHVLVCDEPTAGVDVGAKTEIYRQFSELADQGMGIVLSSSDLIELMGVCHRILVVRSGVIVADLPWTDATEELLMRLQLPQEAAVVT